MANTSIVPACNGPFLPESNFPSTGGDIAARFCTTLLSPHGDGSASCCLPCPATHWLFSDQFEGRVELASYIAIGSLVCNAFLLVTFLVLPREKSHRHYLSIGLTSSFMLVAIAFIIPLGTKPDLCYNAITPHNEKTQASCAATGVFVELGAMGAVVWILLRSLWTTLRITVNLKNVELFKYISIGVGIGLPILFMAISLPITSVTYSLGNVCVPSNPNALQTYFAWILIFTVVSWVVQIGTIAFCIWRFASFSFTPGTVGIGTGHSASDSVTSTDGRLTTPRSQGSLTPKKRKNVAWSRARNILKLQWRSIALAFIIANLVLYFGMFFIQQSAATRFQYQLGAPRLSPEDLDFVWISCLMANNGDKNLCLHGAVGLGLNEIRVEATLIIAALIGIIVFLLMVRGSMFVGWWQVLRNPRGLFRRGSLDDEDLLAQGGARVESAPDQVMEKNVDGKEADQYERRRTSDTLVA